MGKRVRIKREAWPYFEEGPMELFKESNPDKDLEGEIIEADRETLVAMFGKDVDLVVLVQIDGGEDLGFSALMVSGAQFVGKDHIEYLEENNEHSDEN